MKGSRLHLDLFRVFIDLANCKSFAKAAARNNLSQSAVSQQLAFLERHFGKRLIDRGSGGFSLTQEGAAFLEGCGELIDTYDLMDRRLREGRRVLSGTVRIETVYSVGLYELSDHVRTFMRRCPQVNLHVEFNRSDWIYTNVLQGKCDIGIVAYPWAHRLIICLPLKRERMVCVCSPRHPFSKLRRVAPRQMDRQNFIAFDRSIPTGQAIQSLFRKGRIYPNVVHSFDNIETVKRSIEVGMGISILPDITVQQEIKSKILKGIPIAGKPIYRPIGIVLDKRRSLSKPARAFVNWLAGNFRGVPS